MDSNEKKNVLLENKLFPTFYWFSENYLLTVNIMAPPDSLAHYRIYKTLNISCPPPPNHAPLN